MKQIWDAEELAEHWSLSFDDLELLKSKPARHHLAFCLKLKFYQYTGTFPRKRTDFSDTPLYYLADQLETTPDELYEYEWESRTARRHREEILAYLGIKKLDEPTRSKLYHWLAEVIYPQGLSAKEITEQVYEWLRVNKTEFPADKQLQRDLATALSRFENDLFERLSLSITPSAKKLIDDSLDADVDSITCFGQVKADPGRIGLDTVLSEIEKLNFIQSLAMPDEQLVRINTKILSRFKQRIASESAWEAKRHPPKIRYALLIIFFYVRRSEIIDNLVDLFIQIVHRISTRAEKKVYKELLKDFQKVYGKNTLLMRIAQAALEHPDDKVKEVVYPIASVQTLANLVKELKSSGNGYKKEVHKVIRASYGGHYRRMVPAILASLQFRSNNEQHSPVLEALSWIQEHQDIKRQYYLLSEDIPIEGVIRPKWRDVVIETDEHGTQRINRINYEICVLQSLRDRLRCKEIWVIGADRYRNPEDDLPQDFGLKRDFYYNELGKTQDAQLFVTQLQEQMRQALSGLNTSIPKNQKVRLFTSGKNRISITPLSEQAEPLNINRLKGEIQSRWPMTSLLDILKEADLRVNFTDCFQTQRTTERLDRETLQRRLLLTLYGMGTNTGLKRVSASRHGITYKELLHVRRFYVHKNAMRQAICNVANAIFKARNPHLWGEGTTSCASDSKKFGSWDQNLMTEWHLRYGGRGVMIYWHVEKKSTCIYSQLKRCSSSEVASMIEGVLRHCTEMSVDKQYVDTHGQSEVGFAFCHLLGFNLMPRLKNIGSQKLYVPGTGELELYPNLSGILSRPIQWELITQQYEQMIKYATALKQGTADPEAILRRFTRNNVTHPTYRALAELGKVIKTLFLCNYISSEEMRREIHEGLNVVENWNSANSFIFFGKGGEVASNRLEDQELSVLALHLVQICLVYVNTLMIQHVTAGTNWNGVFTAEDYRALSPLIYAHVNPYGIFELDMNQRLPIGDTGT
ncbi:Tn3 family transposase [Rheinheimera sp.]|uniref:Tn3 family transposase n=1 Tax=Rheinheimera sp. TaxID=1869214 RepID=UPI004047F36A